MIKIYACVADNIWQSDIRWPDELLSCREKAIGRVKKKTSVTRKTFFDLYVYVRQKH